MGEAFVTRFDDPGPEGSIVKDMAKKAAIAGPVLIVAFGLIWGIGGALSTAYAIAIVLLNFALSAAILSWSARISLGMLMGATLFGFLIRMGIVLVAVLAVVNTSWVEVVPLAITIVVTHLGLLFWEMRYISASLAFPGLKPTTAKPLSSNPFSSNKESSTS
jgi:hypothetical protein